MDLMIDLETLDTDPSAVVLSIGAVFFCKELGLDRTFYSKLNVDEQLKKGRTISGSTLNWWMQQESQAKKDSFGGAVDSNAHTLFRFNEWVKQSEGPIVWGNGSSFDISILQSLLKTYDLPTPWKFWDVMDLRTFKRFNGLTDVVKQGTAHNALDDAKSQALYVLKTGLI